MNFCYCVTPKKKYEFIFCKVSSSRCNARSIYFSCCPRTAPTKYSVIRNYRTEIVDDNCSTVFQTNKCRMTMLFRWLRQFSVRSNSHKKFIYFSIFLVSDSRYWRDKTKIHHSHRIIISKTSELDASEYHVALALAVSMCTVCTFRFTKTVPTLVVHTARALTHTYTHRTMSPCALRVKIHNNRHRWIPPMSISADTYAHKTHQYTCTPKWCFGIIH